MKSVFVMLLLSFVCTLPPAPATAQSAGVATLKQLQKERVALAKKLSPSVLAVAATRPDLAAEFDSYNHERGFKANAGFVVDDDYVITNSDYTQVMTVEVENGGRKGRRELGIGDSVWLMNDKREEFTGKIVGRDQRNLVFVIKMEDDHPRLPSLKLGDSDAVEIGASCVGLGNAWDSMLYDSAVSFTYGTVSGFYRFEPIGVMQPEDGGDAYRGNVIETDTAILPGDFGGPVCNLDGEVIAMMTGHYMIGRYLSTSVPSNQIRAVLPLLKQGVREDDLPQAWCGFTGGKFDRTHKGVVISEVSEGGPGEKAGLKVGMILLRVDNYRIPSKARLPEMLGQGRLTRNTRYQPSPSVRPYDYEIVVSYGLPISTHILLTVLDVETGKETTVDLLTEQKEDEY